MSLEHKGPVLVVENVTQQTLTRSTNSATPRVTSELLELKFNRANTYDFNNEQYEIIYVSHNPPGHHFVDVKFFQHLNVHHCDDMLNLGHCVPIGKHFPDSTSNGEYKRPRVQNVYLRKMNTS